MQEHATKYLAALCDVIKQTSGPTAMGLLHSMRSIGAVYPALLTPYKSWFEGLLGDAALKEHAQGILDILEGRT